MNSMAIKAVAFAFGTLLVTASGAQEKIKLTVASGQPPRIMPSMAHVPDTFIPEVNKRIKAAGLKYEIEWKEAYAGSLLKPNQVIDGIKDGTADIAMMPAGLFPDKLPLEQVTFAVPFLTSDVGLLSRVLDRLHATMPEYPAQYDRLNQVRLAGTGVDSYELLTTFPVRKIEDIKGKKIATAGAATIWMRGTGAVPVSSNIMEYYNSTKTGVYDGFITVASSFSGMKLPEAAPYVTRVGFGAQYAVVLTMNKDTYGKVPESLRKILVEAATAWGLASDTGQVAAGNTNLQNLSGFKAQLYELPRAEQVRWVNAMPNIAKEWAERMDKQGLPGSKALGVLMAEARKAGAKPLRDWDKE